MVRITLSNWRCIEKLELELSKINLLIGKNSTGKSSLAYSIYFASKLRKFDHSFIINQLYGIEFDKIARIVEGKPQFPILININGSSILIQPSEKGFEVIKKDISNLPWLDEYLLPSRRVNYFHIITFLNKITQDLLKKPESQFLTGFIRSILDILKTLPIMPPFGLFVSDYIRGITGTIRIEPIEGVFKPAGSYLINISIYLPLVALIEFNTIDPYTKLNLPAELSPDGLVDITICDSLVSRVPEKSLIVIEEPEIHKNPTQIIEFTEKLVKKALEKDLTLIITTHSDIPLTSIAKFVSDKKLGLKADDIKVYYFQRSEKETWTIAQEIKLYEDGTFESLPDVEEVASILF